MEKEDGWEVLEPRVVDVPALKKEAASLLQCVAQQKYSRCIYNLHDGRLHTKLLCVLELCGQCPELVEVVRDAHGSAWGPVLKKYLDVLKRSKTLLSMERLHLLESIVDLLSLAALCLNPAAAKALWEGQGQEGRGVASSILSALVLLQADKQVADWWRSEDSETGLTQGPLLAARAVRSLTAICRSDHVCIATSMYSGCCSEEEVVAAIEQLRIGPPPDVHVWYAYEEGRRVWYHAGGGGPLGGGPDAEEQLQSALTDLSDWLEGCARRTPPPPRKAQQEGVTVGGAAKKAGGDLGGGSGGPQVLHQVLHQVLENYHGGGSAGSSGGRTI